VAALATNAQANAFVTKASSPSRFTAAAAAAVPAAYLLGALMLAGEAAVHIQQYIVIFHVVKWVGPLFLANAAASLTAVVALAYGRTRRLAALAGVAISVTALGSLVVSYGHGLFGWHEGGFRTPVAVVTVAEVAAILLLSAALAGSGGRRR
jgi:hypothetical protein